MGYTRCDRKTKPAYTEYRREIDSRRTQFIWRQAIEYHDLDCFYNHWNSIKNPLILSIQSCYAIYNSYKVKLHYIFFLTYKTSTSAVISQYQFLLISKVSTSTVHYRLQLKFTSTRIMISTSVSHIIHYGYNFYDYANRSIHALYYIMLYFYITNTIHIDFFFIPMRPRQCARIPPNI